MSDRKIVDYQIREGSYGNQELAQQVKMMLQKGYQPKGKLFVCEYDGIGQVLVKYEGNTGTLIVDYQVVYGGCCTSLAENINNNLAQGWQPLDGPVVYEYSSFAQAMVKCEFSEEELKNLDNFLGQAQRDVDKIKQDKEQREQFKNNLNGYTGFNTCQVCSRHYRIALGHHCITMQAPVKTSTSYDTTTDWYQEPRKMFEK
jgi:hypothetical protein